ncbi:MAG: hypothetical protein ABIZ56_00800 [Chthoniobacteraceae bacterium]
MNKFAFLPLAAVALLLAGCEATVVESRPIHPSHGYVDRGYTRDGYYRDDSYRQGYYRDGYRHSDPRVRSTDYYVNPGYRSTRSTTYSPARAPYRSASAYRSSGVTAVVETRPQVKRVEVYKAPKGKKKSHKKDDERH